MRRTPRIDPYAGRRNALDQKMGAIDPRQTQRDLRTADRFPDPIPTLIMPISLGPWYREDVAAGSNSGMRLMVMGTGPAFASSGTGIAYKMLRAGRVIGASIYSMSTITAGTVIVGVYINGSFVSGITDCQLNTTNTRSAVYMLPWSSGVPFAVNETVEPRLVADAGLLPAGSADMTVTLYCGFEA